MTEEANVTPEIRGAPAIMIRLRDQETEPLRIQGRITVQSRQGSRSYLLSSPQPFSLFRDLSSLGLRGRSEGET